MAFIMTLWIGNGAVLQSSSQWQNEINHSWTELFNFQILLIAIDWNFYEMHHYLSI